MSEKELRPLSPDDTFQFSCSNRVSCFNACCRDLTQFLSPYDILRLKRHLAMDSRLFLETFTTRYLGPETGLPVVSIKADPQNGWACPFVTEKGCRVYKNRPASCRAYPLARLAFRDRNAGAVRERYYLMSEAHCRGFDQSHRQTVRQWVSAQGLPSYNSANDRFMELIALKKQSRSDPLTPEQRHLFSTALYNLDLFRSRIFQDDLLESDAPDPETLARIEKDDEALLDFALIWVKRRLFGRRGLSPSADRFA